MSVYSAEEKTSKKISKNLLQSYQLGQYRYAQEGGLENNFKSISL